MGTDEDRGETARRANSEGLAALRGGDGAGAVRAFTQATAADPAAGALWRNLAHAHRLLGDPASERAALERALEIDRTDFVAQLRLAQLLEREGEALAALTAWSGTLQLAERLPATPPALMAELAAGRGYVSGLTTRLGAASDRALAPFAERLGPTGQRRMSAFVDLALGQPAGVPQPVRRRALPVSPGGRVLRSPTISPGSTSWKPGRERFAPNSMHCWPGATSCCGPMSGSTRGRLPTAGANSTGRSIGGPAFSTSTGSPTSRCSTVARQPPPCSRRCRWRGFRGGRPMRSSRCFAPDVGSRRTPG